MKLNSYPRHEGPLDEVRLRALADYAILDTPPEQGFDDVVFLASQMCETSVALVSLVGKDRQWFKARVGFEPCQTPIGQSVCQFALREPGLLMIPDLTLDPRTAKNTLVTEDPHIRFYAGAPLITPDGLVLGSLCVIDGVPRPGGLTKSQQDGLLALARQVMSLLEMRRAVAVRDEQLVRQAALSELGDRLRDVSDVGLITLVASGVIGRALGATRAGFGAVDIGTETIAVHTDWCVDRVSSVAGNQKFRDYGSFIDDLKRGRNVVIDDVDTDPRTERNAADLHSIGVGSLINLPVIEHGAFVLMTFVHHDVPHRWSTEELDFLRQAGDRTRAAIARTRAEEEQRNLTQELGHRMKNTLAMVQAVVTQTFRTARTIDEGREAITGRINALARAQDIFTELVGEGTDIRDVVERALAPHRTGEGRIRVHGPSVMLTAQQGLGLSLALHELATNAAKYGAMSMDNGLVDVRWSVGADLTFKFFWLESDGPAVVPPARSGFGSKLIERIVAPYFHGTARLLFEPEGIAFELSGTLT